MFTTAHLSYCGFNFNGLTDIDRRDVELMLQRRNQGLKPNYDYIFQPMQAGWQVSGVTAMGARAVSVVASALKIIPNRLDVTLAIHDCQDIGLSYEGYYSRLRAWFQVNKPKLNVTDMLPIGGDKKVLFGSKNSRWCLWLAEHTDPLLPFGGYALELTFAVRNENCFSAWEYFVGCSNDKDFELYSKEAFAAIQNSILGTEFFGLSLPAEPYLHKEKPAAEQKDWYSYLSTVAKKMVKHYLDEPEATTESDLAFLHKEIVRQLDLSIPSVVN